VPTWMSFVTDGRRVMTDDHPEKRTWGRPSETLPLFYRKKTRPNGESDEISVGPCAVRIVRWICALIAIAMVVMMGEASSTLLLKFLLRLVP
jgi:hypothetical protein